MAHDFKSDRPGPAPIFTNEFDKPREPPVIKPVIKIGQRLEFLGHTCIVMGIEGQASALLAYADDAGIIHTLAVPQAVL